MRIATVALACCVSAVAVPLVGGVRQDEGAEAAPRFPDLPRGPGLAASFPLDDGIAEHEQVLFAERFDGADLEAVLDRWTEHLAPDEDVLAVVEGGPVPTADGRVLRVTATPSRNHGGWLYRRLDRGVDRMYARFCVRFPAQEQEPFVHHFVHLGGYEPSTPWPQGHAGERPAGDDRVTVGIEPFAADDLPLPGHWAFYAYWHEMKISADDRYWGNGIHPRERLSVPTGRWQTVEVMVALNTPGERDGELALWLDGEPALHVRAGTPRASWSGLGFEVLAEGAAEAEPFEGFSWRTSADLRLDFFELLHYVTPRAARRVGAEDLDVPVVVEFDHVVVATSYVGPVAPPRAAAGGATGEDGR